MFCKTYIRSHYFDAPEPIYTFWKVELYGYDYDAIQPGGDKVIKGRERMVGSISTTLSDQDTRAEIITSWKTAMGVDPTEEQLNSHLTTLEAQRRISIREGKKKV
jgi:hypothetical protein